MAESVLPVGWAYCHCVNLFSGERLPSCFWLLSAQCTLYFPPICKSNCCAVDYFTRGFCHIPPALQLWKLPQIPTFILADFSHHLSKIVIIRFLCFFAVEKQTGLWTDHYINSFLKGGSYFKKGWRNAKRDLNFNLNLFQQVKGSFERGFQQRWWYLKVINKHLNLQWKTVILLLSSVGEELGSLWSHPKKKRISNSSN